MPTAIAIREVEGKPGKVYYPLEKIDVPAPAELQPDQVRIQILAASLNHRDLFIRQHLYPGTAFGIPLCADGCGTVTATGSGAEARRWQGKRVIVNPGQGWKDNADGPEDPTGYSILGGTKLNRTGTLVDELVIGAAELEEAPGHLDAVGAAALPLTGLTAWRAVVTKAGAHAAVGANVLVTGIGGGVALMALLFAKARGARVFGTSGSEDKLAKAKTVGADGGVIYKKQKWEDDLTGLLPADRPYIDAIIDGAAGDIVDKGMRLLKLGGVIVQYGMTLGPKMSWNMGAVLRNVDLKGSTMGSRKEFADMVEFTKSKRLQPVISRVLGDGLSNIEGLDSLFDDMKKGSQFGKLVVEVAKESPASRL